MSTKECTKCGVAHPLTEYVRHATTRDGLHPWCKTCKAANRAAYYMRNRGAARSYQTAYKTENPHVAWAACYRERALRYGLLPIVEEFTRDDVVRCYGDACWHCGDKFEQLDHYPTPVIDGGTHEIANVRPSCGSCNRKTWRGEVVADATA